MNAQRKPTLTIIKGRGVKQRRELNIHGIIFPVKMREVLRHQNFNRHYTDNKRAVECLTRWMLNYGQVGDVCEISNKLTGKQIGTIKMTLKGKLVTTFVWDDEQV